MSTIDSAAWTGRRRSYRDRSNAYWRFGPLTWTKIGGMALLKLRFVADIGLCLVILNGRWRLTHIEAPPSMLGFDEDHSVFARRRGRDGRSISHSYGAEGRNWID